MHYFDTSFIAPLFLLEEKSKYVEDILQSIATDRTISHWLRVEFASIIARNVRMKIFTKTQATQMLDQFETVISNSFQIITPSATDFNLAISLLSHPNSGLRSGDALHLAIAKNHHATKFYTLDYVLEKAAKSLTKMIVIS